MRPEARRGEGLLWVLRLGILAMLSVGLAALYSRYHLSDEQIDMLRYVEVDLQPLLRVEDNVEGRLTELLASKTLTAAQMRGRLTDDSIPALLRLRKLAEAPLRVPRSAKVIALSQEYLTVVDGFIDGCRTAVRAIDDPAPEGRDGRDGLKRIHAAFAAAARGRQEWQEHVQGAGRALRLEGRYAAPAANAAERPGAARDAAAGQVR